MNPTPPSPQSTRPTQPLTLDQALFDIRIELASLRAIAVRSETRLVTLARALGHGDKLETKTPNPTI